jgi:hypothetical protein
VGRGPVVRHDALVRLADGEARRLTVVGELRVRDLVTTIAGLNTVGRAAILAETGDLTRFVTRRVAGVAFRVVPAGQRLRRLPSSRT